MEPLELVERPQVLIEQAGAVEPFVGLLDRGVPGVGGR
jgi:hypothetical protein